MAGEQYKTPRYLTNIGEFALDGDKVARQLANLVEDIRVATQINWGNQGARVDLRTNTATSVTVPAGSVAFLDSPANVRRWIYNGTGADVAAVTTINQPQGRQDARLADLVNKGCRLLFQEVS